MLATVDGAEIRLLSPSEIGTWNDCEAKWFHKYVRKVETAESESAKLGKAFHAQMERWLKKGIRPDDSREGKLAEAVLHLWPAPQDVDPANVEVHIFFEREGVYFHGLVDVRGQFPGEGSWVVGDHKSTTDFKWAKTQTQLREDVQANVYALATMDELEIDSVLLRWGYVNTNLSKRIPPVHSVEISISREQAEKNIARTIPVARRILAAYTEPKESRALNPEACDRYGGCPFKHLCGVTPAERLVGAMTLAEKLRAQSQGVNPPPPAVSAPTAVPPTPNLGVPTTPPGKSVIAQLRASAASASNATTAQAPSAITPSPETSAAFASQDALALELGRALLTIARAFK